MTSNQDSTMFTPVPSTTQLFAPQPVKPRRRQKSLDKFFTTDCTQSDNHQQQQYGAPTRQPSMSSLSGTNSNTMLQDQVDEMEELFQIMKRANFGTSQSPGNGGEQLPQAQPPSPYNQSWNDSSFYAFPTSPVARNCRNPMIFNPAFQEKNTV